MYFITKRALVQFTGLAALIYAALAIVIKHSVLIEVLNGFFMGLVTGVTIVFAPLFMRAIATREFDRITQLTVAIISSWLSLILSRTTNAFNRIVSASDVCTSDNWTISLGAYIAIVSGVLYITAPGMLDGHLKYHRGVLWIAFFVGLGVASMAIYLQRLGGIGLPILSR